MSKMTNIKDIAGQSARADGVLMAGEDIFAASDGSPHENGHNSETKSGDLEGWTNKWGHKFPHILGSGNFEYFRFFGTFSALRWGVLYVYIALFFSYGIFSFLLVLHGIALYRMVS